jgi:hypothetical protein
MRRVHARSLRRTRHERRHAASRTRDAAAPRPLGGHLSAVGATTGRATCRAACCVAHDAGSPAGWAEWAEWAEWAGWVVAGA